MAPRASSAICVGARGDWLGRERDRMRAWQRGKPRWQQQTREVQMYSHRPGIVGVSVFFPGLRPFFSPEPETEETQPWPGHAAVLH